MLPVTIHLKTLETGVMRGVIHCVTCVTHVDFLVTCFCLAFALA